MFNKGDTVILRKDLVLKQYYDSLPYFEDLSVWQGKEMTIQKRYTKLENTLYIVDENNYTWSEGMLDAKR